MLTRYFLLMIAGVAAGCSSSNFEATHLAPAQFRSSSAAAKGGPKAGQARDKTRVAAVGPCSASPGRPCRSPGNRAPYEGSGKSAAGLVEQSLHARGIRFGTDGTPQSLLAFAQSRYPLVAPPQASPGDVVFFNLGTGCGDHAGIVETAETSGRIGFREWRDGSNRHSYVTPGEPTARRDGKGRILNTFLRPKRVDDDPRTRYFAGEMLCGVYRVTGP